METLQILVVFLLNGYDQILPVYEEKETRDVHLTMLNIIGDALDLKELTHPPSFYWNGTG